MKEQITTYYAIKDIRTNSYLNLFPSDGDVHARRQFEILKRNKDSIVGQFPTDFLLFKVCDFDNLRGVFIPYNVEVCELVGDDDKI